MWLYLQAKPSLKVIKEPEIALSSSLNSLIFTKWLACAAILRTGLTVVFCQELEGDRKVG